MGTERTSAHRRGQPCPVPRTKSDRASSPGAWWISIWAERTRLGQLDHVQLLALLGPRDVRGQKRVHEGLEVGPPPLRERVTDLPLVVDGLAAELAAHGRQALVQPSLEALDLVVLGSQVVAWSVWETILLARPESQWVSNSRRTNGCLYSRHAPSTKTHSLKNALAICSMRMCGWLCSWQTSTPSHVRRMPCWS